MSGADAQFQPVFVVGCERSGTTLLAVLLGRHSSIAMMPETHFFRMVKRGENGKELSHEELMRRFLANRLPAPAGVDAEKVKQRFAMCPASYASLLRALLEEFAAERGKARGGEKTPLHLHNVPMIIRWFPQARIVGIVRDGRDVCLSLLAMPWEQEKRLRALCWRWRRLLRMARTWEARYPRHFLLIRYEDLLLHPEATLGKVDEFLGEQFEAAQLNPDIATEVVDVSNETWKADAVREIDPTRIAGWKQKATVEQIRMMNGLIGTELQSCGYGDTQYRRSIADIFAAAWYRWGLFNVWERAVAKHFPGARARRRAARNSR